MQKSFLEGGRIIHLSTFYLLTTAPSISYFLRDATRDYSVSSLSFCLPKKIQDKKKCDTLYLEFCPHTGNFVGILDEKAQSVDPTTLTLSDIQFYRSLSPESGTIHSDVNSEEIRLNLGDVGQMNGVAYIGNTFLFKMDHDGRKLN
jgi:hypothetical protein